jgi:hypothetical protein
MNPINENEIVCRADQRRFQVRGKARNGLDYLEVQEGNPQGPEPTILQVFFIGAAPDDLEVGNFAIAGGVRIRDIRVVAAERISKSEEDLDDYWRLTLNRFGDFSSYTMRVVKADAKGRPSNKARDDFDPRYSSLSFTF